MATGFDDTGHTGDVQYGNIGFQDIQSGQNFGQQAAASGNVKAQGEMQTALTEQQGGTVAGYFQEEQTRQKRQAALQEATDQTSQMQRAATIRTQNFDESLAHQRQLGAMDSAATTQIMAEKNQFAEDSFGRKQLSENQLNDWYTTRAGNEESWSNYQQRSSQLHTQKIAIMQMSYAKISQMQTQMAAGQSQLINEDLLKVIDEKKSALAAQIKKEQADAANSSAIIGALGTVAATYGGYVLAAM